MPLNELLDNGYQNHRHARLYPLIPIDDHSCNSDIDHGEMVSDKFFVACGDSPILFERADGAFNDVSLLVY